MELLKTIVIGALSASLLFSTSASAGEGVATGNGGLITGIKFSLSDEHPYGAELIQLIDKAKLPTAVKESLLVDLSSVSILYSDESFTFKDLDSTINWELLYSTKVEVTENGTTRERVRSVYRSVEELNKYGLYYHAVGEIKSTNSDPRLAAMTSASENKVIYFNPGLKALTKEEQMKLVLHEQAHRLTQLLGRKTNDERFVEGWAQGLYDYLVGKTTSDAFYNLLKRNGIDTFSATDAGALCQPQCFANEQLVNSASATFEANIALLIKPSDIKIFGPASNDRFFLVLDANAFSNYPLIAKEKEIKISLKVDGQAAYDLVNSVIASVRANPNGQVMNFTVRYSRLLTVNDSGKTVQNASLERLQLSTESFSNQMARLREYSKPYFNKITVSNIDKPFALFDAQLKHITQEGMGQLILWAQQLQESNPSFALKYKLSNIESSQHLEINPFTNEVQEIVRDISRGYEPTNKIKVLQVGLVNLQTSKLPGDVKTCELNKNIDGVEISTEDSGVTDEDMCKVVRHKDVQAIVSSLKKISDSYMIKIGFTTSQVGAKVTTDYGYTQYSGCAPSLLYFRGLNIRVSRNLKDRPDLFAIAIRQVLQNKTNYRWGKHNNNQSKEDALLINSYYNMKFDKKGNMRMTPQRVSTGCSAASMPTQYGADLLQSLGLD